MPMFFNKINFLVCLLALVTITSAMAQNARDTLSIERGFFKKHYYQGDKSIKRKEFNALLSSTEASQTIADEAYNSRIFALNSGILGTSVFVYSLHQYFFNTGFPTNLMPVGTVLLSATIPLIIVRRIKIDKAIRVYNQGLKQTG
jgi:short subunit fatty acids transporter